MDLGSIKGLGYELGAGLDRKYGVLLNAIEESDNPIDCLEKLCLMFGLLGESRPDEGKAIEWARDIINAYRNTAKLVEQCSVYMKKGDESENEKINKVLEDYKTLLADFPGENSLEELAEALDYFKGINDFLKEYGIENLETLKEFFQKPDEEYLQNRLNDFESDFS